MELIVGFFVWIGTFVTLLLAPVLLATEFA